MRNDPSFDYLIGEREQRDRNAGAAVLLMFAIVTALLAR
jgi:hypothetical protein